MIKKHLLIATTVTMFLCGGFFLARHFHITREIACKLPRIIAREAYYTYIVREKAGLDRMPHTIKDGRLTLTKLRLQDFEYYHPIIGNPYCADSFFINSSINLVPYVDPNLYLYIQLAGQFFGSRCMYSVIDNATQKIGGMVEIIYIRDTTTGKKEHYEISGFARPREWGNGKALEATAIAIEAFFKATNEEELLAFTAPYNNRCHTFLLKSGFVFSHVCKEEHSKNELVFKINRTQGFEIKKTVHELLRRQRSKMNCSESPSAANHQEQSLSLDPAKASQTVHRP